MLKTGANLSRILGTISLIGKKCNITWEEILTLTMKVGLTFTINYYSNLDERNSAES